MTNHNRTRPAIILLVMILAACGPGGATIGQQTPTIKSESFTAPLDEAAAATVTIDAPFEKVFVSASSDSANLIDAEVEYLGDLTFSHENNEVMLAESGTFNNLASLDKPLRWNVLLHPSPALALNLDISSGEIALDASGLNLTALNLEASSGTIDADLPAMSETLTASVDVSSGQITVNLADNAVVDLTSGEVSSGQFNLNVGADSNVTLSDLSVSSGGIKVDVPTGTAVRLEVLDVSSGSVNIAYSMVRVSGSGSDEGIWETEGFAEADHQVERLVRQIAGQRVAWRERDGVVRELGPLISAVVLTGFAGAAVAAELGTMVVGEEIEALEAMALNPIRFLVVPRVTATMLGLIFLAVFADIVAIVAGGVMGVLLLDIPVGIYKANTLDQAQLSDFLTGIFKAGVFGFLIGIIACYNGLRVSGGAAGVGKATTKTVVDSIVSIIFADLTFTALFFALGWN